jgi:hypothetical protein
MLSFRLESVESRGLLGSSRHGRAPRTSRGAVLRAHRGRPAPGTGVEVQVRRRHCAHDGQPLAGLGRRVEASGHVNPDDRDLPSSDPGKYARGQVGPLVEG